MTDEKARKVNESDDATQKRRAGKHVSEMSPEARKTWERVSPHFDCQIKTSDGGSFAVSRYLLAERSIVLGCPFSRNCFISKLEPGLVAKKHCKTSFQPKHSGIGIATFCHRGTCCMRMVKGAQNHIYIYA